MFVGKAVFMILDNSMQSPHAMIKDLLFSQYFQQWKHYTEIVNYRFILRYSNRNTQYRVVVHIKRTSL